MTWGPYAGREPGCLLPAERVVLRSGNRGVRGRQIWFGPALAGTAVTPRIDVNRLHALIDGARQKTLPAKLSGRAYGHCWSAAMPGPPARGRRSRARSPAQW